MKLRILAVLPVLLLASACARSGTDSSPAGPPVTPSASACPATLNVTVADQDKTLCVAANGKVMVDLGDEKDRWLPIEADGSSLAVIPTFVATPGKAMFNATKTGTAVITSSRSNCPSASPGTVSCHSIVAWKVTVDVK